MNVMRSLAIIVVVLLVVLGGVFLTGIAESHVCYPETRLGVRSQNFTPEIEKAGSQNPDYISFEQFITDNFTSSTLVIQKEFDSTHLAYFGARYYDPTSGRFTNPDPFMGHLTDLRSQSMYGYGFNNPFSFWDLFGFQSRRVDKDGNLLYKHEVVPYYSQKEIDEINEGFFLQFYDRLTMGMTAQEKEQVIRLENMIKRAEASGDQEKIRQAITELVNFKVDQIKFDPTGCAGGIKIVGKQASKPASKILIRHIDDLIARLNKFLKTDAIQRGAGADVSYIVDEAGLTLRAEGRITGPHTGRGKGYRPEPIGGRTPGEHRGHLIPEGGVDDPSLVNVKQNIIPETAASNLGPKKKFDNLVSRIAIDNPNSVVKVIAEPLRKSGILRPHAVTYWIEKDGVRIYGVTIYNK